MGIALDLAREAAQADEVPVGAIIVRDDQILAQARNRIVELHDPTAHAELLAIREAAQKINNERILGATLVTTLEPCPMCLGATLLARIERLVMAAEDPKSGAAGSVVDLARSDRLNHRIEVVTGIRAEESARLLKDFFRAKRRGAGAAERARLESE